MKHANQTFIFLTLWVIRQRNDNTHTPSQLDKIQSHDDDDDYDDPFQLRLLYIRNANYAFFGTSFFTFVGAHMEVTFLWLHNRESRAIVHDKPNNVLPSIDASSAWTTRKEEEKRIDNWYIPKEREKGEEKWTKLMVEYREICRLPDLWLVWIYVIRVLSLFLGPRSSQLDEEEGDKQSNAKRIAVDLFYL